MVCFLLVYTSSLLKFALQPKWTKVALNSHMGVFMVKMECGPKEDFHHTIDRHKIPKIDKCNSNAAKVFCALDFLKHTN